MILENVKAVDQKSGKASSNAKSLVISKPGFLFMPLRESVCPHAEVLSPPVTGNKLRRGLDL